MRPGNVLKIGLVGGLVLVTLVFAYFKAHDLLFCVSIAIESPKNGETLSSAFVTIIGTAPGNTMVTLNGAKVLTDAAGRFEKELLLGLGYNVIEIKVLDRFNRAESKTLELVYKPRENNIEEVALLGN